MADHPRVLKNEIERVFREEGGKILASLIRVLGEFDIAEEALQDSFAAALQAWPRDGVPDNPGAWITTAARRKAIDRLRRERLRGDREEEHARHRARRDVALDDIADQLSRAVEDDRLRLIFTCCHPALSDDAQVALTLKTLGGLSVIEIARAFLVPVSTMEQRLVRARRKIKAANIPYRVPPDDLLPTRVPAVLTTLYLIFNEGYTAAIGADPSRRELCAEAIRLARMLVLLMPREPETGGLLALMLLQDSRRDARATVEGETILLEDQDRSRWDHDQIGEGRQLLARALRFGVVGSYQLQATIAAVHATAKSAEETDWSRIVTLYNGLLAIHPSPVVALNRAVAVAMADGPKAGLAALEEIEPDGALETYLYFHATRGELLRRLARDVEAAASYRRARMLAETDSERRFLDARIAALPPR